MKFSTNLPGLARWPPAAFAVPGANWQEQLGPDGFKRIVQTADELGFDSINVPEHIVMPTSMVPQMGAMWPDAFTVMAWIAGATSRIVVNSGVIVLPYHQPVPLAKAIATLDVLTGGRVMLTFGAGMARGEFAALGVPFEKRGRIVDEYVAAMKVLWTEDEPDFVGEFVEFHDVVFEPKPVQRPHPPIIIGGSSIFACRRAARIGDGWAPMGAQGGNGPWLNGPEDLPMFLAEARTVPGFVEREAEFQLTLPALPTRIGPDHTIIDPGFTLTSTQQVIDLVATVREAGATWTAVPPLEPGARSLAEHLEHLEWAATEVIPHFR
ncbi:MAG: TIGR03619 family F420-dependent LLM class oxidoreductase [Ilumatobacteraceae bacterium]